MLQDAYKEIQNIAFIVDGNRRWAKDRGLPSLMGHKAGFDRLKEVCEWVKEAGIPHMAAYVFSTENWNRSQEEVSYLMELFDSMAKEWGNSFVEKGIRVRFIGRLDMLPENVRVSISDLEQKSSHNTALTVWVCISYGGRAEILAAARNFSGESEEDLKKAMWSAEMPDPDIIVRSGGEMRLSNFLLWQGAYSELFFIKPYWPDFDRVAFDALLAEYAERNRRHGK